jgi:hypothetical protein
VFEAHQGCPSLQQLALRVFYAHINGGALDDVFIAYRDNIMLTLSEYPKGGIYRLSAPEEGLTALEMVWAIVKEMTRFVTFVYPGWKNLPSPTWPESLPRDSAWIVAGASLPDILIDEERVCAYARDETARRWNVRSPPESMLPLPQIASLEDKRRQVRVLNTVDVVLFVPDKGAVVIHFNQSQRPWQCKYRLKVLVKDALLRRSDTELLHPAVTDNWLDYEGVDLDVEKDDCGDLVGPTPADQVDLQCQLALTALKGVGYKTLGFVGVNIKIRGSHLPRSGKYKSFDEIVSYGCHARYRHDALRWWLHGEKRGKMELGHLQAFSQRYIHTTRVSPHFLNGKNAEYLRKVSQQVKSHALDAFKPEKELEWVLGSLYTKVEEASKQRQATTPKPEEKSSSSTVRMLDPARSAFTRVISHKIACMPFPSTPNARQNDPRRRRSIHTPSSQ